MDISWIKISTTMFEDDKIRIIDSMPDRDALLLIWVKLLAQAGKCNAGGYLVLSETVPLNAESLASLFNRPLNTVRLALDTFERLGMISVAETVSITNWSKHQNTESMDRIRELGRARSQKYREKISNVTRNVTITQSNGDRKQIKEEDDAFAQFYSSYPKRKNRSSAEKAFARLNPSPELFEKMIAALDWQKQQPEWLKNNGQFIPLPASWLNERRWEDERPATLALPTTGASDGGASADYLRKAGLIT